MEEKETERDRDRERDGDGDKEPVRETGLGHSGEEGV